MAALAPVAAVALGAIDLLQRQATAQNDQRRLALEQRARRENTESRIEQLRADQAEADRRRREALLHSLAETRARLGAAGVGTASGSGAALLEGLASASAGEAAADADRTNRRIRDLSRNVAYDRALNLLERSEREARARLGLIRDTAALRGTTGRRNY